MEVALVPAHQSRGHSRKAGGVQSVVIGNKKGQPAGCYVPRAFSIATVQHLGPPRQELCGPGLPSGGTGDPLTRLPSLNVHSLVGLVPEAPGCAFNMLGNIGALHKPYCTNATRNVHAMVRSSGKARPKRTNRSGGIIAAKRCCCFPFNLAFVGGTYEERRHPRTGEEPKTVPSFPGSRFVDEGT